MWTDRVCSLRWGRGALRLVAGIVLFSFMAIPYDANAIQRRSGTRPAPLPKEIASSRFVLKVNGQEIAVAHAAANYYFANFDVCGPVTVTITAPTNDYWSVGVEIKPWRLGIRPKLKGRTISFRLDKPAKISITRVLWQGPGVPQGLIPAAALSHTVQDENSDATVQ